MKILSFILIAYSVLMGCAKKNMDTITSYSPAVYKTSLPDTVSYLALGDSYTIGEAVPAEQSFPHQLTGLLKAGSYPEARMPVIIARTGWTTDELTAAIKAANISRKFSYVTLLIGVNNQYRGYNVNTYRTEFTQLLQTAINYAGGNIKRVFVLSVPDWGVTPYAAGSDRNAIATQIDEYNAVNRQETIKAGANYIDITATSRRAAYDLSLVAKDGLHPSGIMYGLWAQQLIGPVTESLK